MALTHKQELPNRPVEKQEWTVRKLFSFGGAVSSITKTFSNPFDVLLGFLVLVVGVVELLGRHVSWFFWVFAIFILIADLAERHRLSESEPKHKDNVAVHSTK